MRLLAPILAALRRVSPGRDGGGGAPGNAEAPAPGATRALCRAIDEALARGHEARAWRIAASAERFLDRSPRLAERVARLHMVRGDIAAALDAVEACRAPGASLRLLRTICLLLAGRPADAHLDLHRWAGRSTAPLEARVLLAVLEWKAGRRDVARAALHRNLRQIEDPLTLALLLAMAVTREDREGARGLARRLRRATACTPQRDEAELLIQSLGLPAARAAVGASPLHVRSLAAELVAAEVAIPSLLEAQRLDPDPETIELLIGALDAAREELAAPVTAMLAAAELELLRDHPQAARDRAREALRRSPMSAAAALLVRRANAALYGLERRRRPLEGQAA